MPAKLIKRGRIPFSIESRILRELGERLVKQPEVALLELIKNSYDADAPSCTVSLGDDTLSVRDDGKGMTLEEFSDAWMRIGTSSKERSATSEKFKRDITGEKGIGRFAVRFLGKRLQLTTTAFDAKRKQNTTLQADFDWPAFDASSDLGSVTVPYTLTVAEPDAETGTLLEVSDLREGVEFLDWRKVQTGSIGVVTAVRSLLASTRRPSGSEDPGFRLITGDDDGEEDLSRELLDLYILKAAIRLEGDRLSIRVFKPGEREPYLQIDDKYPNEIGYLRSDIRFFPRRPGTFEGSPVDGRMAYGWVRSNSGVKVFDRGFQMQPYGEEGDDWLWLKDDASANKRDPRSTIAIKHFPMSPEVKADPALNWMLRIPQPVQLIGAVEVRGKRTKSTDASGLVAAADREGFLANAAYAQLVDVVRGAAEMIAVADRQLQQEEKAAAERLRIEKGRGETQEAIAEINADERLSPTQRSRIVAMLLESQTRLEHQEESAKEREQQLEVMSLLGVVGGFMTHEFGIAIAELKEAEESLREIALKDASFKDRAKRFAKHITHLESFVAYSQLYIRAAKQTPDKPYLARPRLSQVKKLFDIYAADRSIKVEIETDPAVLAPRVPIALYNGITQNLLTNALKAVTASTSSDRRLIVLRAWNQNDKHHLQVSDTGIGIPSAVQKLIFDPLFTTTADRKDPLGSGMGLGLALVRRGAAAFGGSANLIKPPPGFSTSVEVTFPMTSQE